MKPPLYVRKTTASDRDGQPARWTETKKWESILIGHAALRQALTDEVEDRASIRREFVHGYADKDPVELFLATMAWGFGSTNARWPKQSSMLSSPPRRRIQAIVKAVQKDGAEAGWRALFAEKTKVSGLGYAFGTKLLYFAGYKFTQTQRPLILDWNDKIALLDSGAGVCVHPEMWRSDYLDYIDLAEDWAKQITASGNEIESDVVEYALFERGRQLLSAENGRRSAAKVQLK